MRRFPPPWTVEKIPGGLKVVDANGQSLAYVYSREKPDDAHIAKVLTEDEARRIASNIAKLPTLLGKASQECYRGYSRCRLFLLWRNFFNERLTMDQRDDDDPMLEINGRIKALIVEAMKANKGADPHDLLAEIVGKLSFQDVPHILGDYVHSVLHELIDPDSDEEARPH